MRLGALIVLALQALVMLVDETHFHRRRGLPRWERIGHPIDTASVLACCLVALLCEPTPRAVSAYTALAIGSCLLVTKDEFVHSRECEPAEQWLHSLLFVLHPLMLIALAVLWVEQTRAVLLAQTVATAVFGSYQAIYWNLIAAPRRSGTAERPVFQPGSE